MMKKNLFIILFFFCGLINSSSAKADTRWSQTENTTKKSWLIAENSTEKKEELNAYDPFADYSEFENTAEEQENINFFQTGRFLTLGVLGGVKLFTLNMAILYQIGPVYGGYLNYFFDLQFSIQFGLTASTHEVILQDQQELNFLGAADFLSMGLDFKYFFDKSLFSKNFSWLQPYVFLGVFNASVTMVATYTDQLGFTEASGFGLNMGLGIELHFMKKIHFGLEYAFKFVTLENEAIPLRLNVGNNQQNTNFRPYGDWMNITLLLGVNF